MDSIIAKLKDVKEDLRFHGYRENCPIIENLMDCIYKLIKRNRELKAAKPTQEGQC